MAKIVVFLDALDPRRTRGFVKNIQQGKYRCHFPVVTPTIMGSILTGKSPGEHGLISPTKLYGTVYKRTIHETIIEKISRRMKIMSYAIPFTCDQTVLHGTVNAGEPDGSGVLHVGCLQFPEVGIDMGHVDPGRALDIFTDDAILSFTTLRHLVRLGAADTFFWGFRNLDSFTHWFQDGDYYDRLVDVLNVELEKILNLGSDVDLFVFSDHGSMPAHELFRINIWLQEQGYLSANMLLDNHVRMMERKAKRRGKPAYADQIGPHSPFLEISKDSMFVSADAYDSCIDVLRNDVTESDIQELCGALMETGFYHSVKTREELYPDLNEFFYNKLPKIIPHRKEGVLVSANMMPGLPAVGFTDHEEIMNFRNGDHWPEGYFGSTLDLQLGEDVIPEDLYHAIDAFAGESAGPITIEQPPLTEDEQELFSEKLADMGYV